MRMAEFIAARVVVVWRWEIDVRARQLVWYILSSIEMRSFVQRRRPETKRDLRHCVWPAARSPLMKGVGQSAYWTKGIDTSVCLFSLWIGRIDGLSCQSSVDWISCSDHAGTTINATNTHRAHFATHQNESINFANSSRWSNTSQQQQKPTIHFGPSFSRSGVSLETMAYRLYRIKDDVIPFRRWRWCCVWIGFSMWTETGARSLRSFLRQTTELTPSRPIDLALLTQEATWRWHQLFLIRDGHLVK